MSDRTTPFRRVRAPMALLCLAATLAGCGTQPGRHLTYATWQQSEPLPRLRVESVPISHEVAFAPRSTQLGEVEREALLRFLRQTRVRAGDTVVLTAAPPEPGRPDRSAARFDALRVELARLGVSTRTMLGAVPGVSSDEVLITAQTLAVVPPDCPGYNAPIALDSEQKPILDIGCANAANLGLMVANPADLVRGRALRPADGEAAALSIQRYRAGQVWPLGESQDSVPFRMGTD